MLQEIYNAKLVSRGFTLIELLIAIGISLILAASAVSPIYGNLQGSAQLFESSAQIMQTFRTARERSVAGVGDTSHGVYFNIQENGTDSVILYRGTTYALRDTSHDRRITLPASLALSLTTGNDVNFSQGNGIPSESGAITIVHAVHGSDTITINVLGVIEKE